MTFSTRTLPGLAATLLVTGLAWCRPIPTTRPTTLPDLRIDPHEWIEDPTIVEVRPGGELTIQDAVSRAKPGTVINVRAGDYSGHLDLSNVHGTPGRPILLLSADGPGKARLVGEPKSRHATVGAWGVSNLGIYGFEIYCDTAEGDVGGVKIAGPWASPAENVTVAGNLVTGRGQDGVKFFNGARHVVVAGNVIAGTWRQECFDNVSVEKAVFAYNTTTPSTARYTSLTMKRGSRDFEVLGNEFMAETWAQVSVGGYGDSKGRVRPPYWETKFMAARVHVYGNELGPDVSVHFAGGRDSDVRNNRIRGRVTSSPSGERDARDMPSENNAVADNDALPGPVGAAALPPDLLDLRPGGGLRHRPTGRRGEPEGRRRAHGPAPFPRRAARPAVPPSDAAPAVAHARGAPSAEPAPGRVQNEQGPERERGGGRQRGPAAAGRRRAGDAHRGANGRDVAPSASEGQRPEQTECPAPGRVGRRALAQREAGGEAGRVARPEQGAFARAFRALTCRLGPRRSTGRVLQAAIQSEPDAPADSVRGDDHRAVDGTWRHRAGGPLQAPFTGLHAGGPDGLFAGRIELIAGIFAAIEATQPAVPSRAG